MENQLKKKHVSILHASKPIVVVVVVLVRNVSYGSQINVSVSAITLMASMVCFI